jgi:hypothetical protein
MSLDHTFAPTNGLRLAPVDRRHAPLFCLALLTVSCAMASSALACATPFAAFAVVAAAMLSLRPAVLVVTGAWLVNQAIGFGVLHYPVDGNTTLWGLVIGAAASVATLIAASVLRILPQGQTLLALALALICGYGGYEVILFTATPFLGGAGSFTAAIVARLGLLSAAWLIGLVAASEIVRLLNSARQGYSAS